MGAFSDTRPLHIGVGDMIVEEYRLEKKKKKKNQVTAEQNHGLIHFILPQPVSRNRGRLTIILLVLME